MDKPKVSVIIPTYNRGYFVKNAIESVLIQSFKDREVIVVDDGSTDDTRSELTGFEGQIRYLYQENSGVSSARNSGIMIAQGQWLAFLDSDDEWCPDYLSTQMEILENAPAVCMQTSNCCFIGLKGERTTYFDINRVSSVLKGRASMDIPSPFLFIISHGPWQVGSTIISKAAVRSAGMFDESIGLSEDLDLMARVSLHGGFRLIKESLVKIYRRNEPAKSQTEQARSHPIQARESDEKLYRKLAALGSLKPDERKMLRRLLSANRRAMGNLYKQNGELSKARVCYQKAISFDCSIRSLGRYLLSFL